MTALPNKHYDGHRSSRRNWVTNKYLEKDVEKRNVESWIEVQLEKDGGGSRR